MKYKKTLFLLLATTTISVGYSAWVIPEINGYTGNLAFTPSKKQIVCYVVDSNNKTTYYTSIDKALTVASSNETADKIYVKPSIGTETNPLTIEKTHTIKKQDVLYLPYKEGEACDTILEWNAANKANYAKFAIDNKKAYLKSFISLKADLVNEGQIEIGGITSGGNGGYTLNSNTCADFAMLSIEKNVTLHNRGKIICTGYVQGEGLIKNSKEGQNTSENPSMIIPFNVVEHRGGAVFSLMLDMNTFTEDYKKFNCTPFNRIFTSNLLCKTKFYSDSVLKVRATMSANKQNNTSDILAIGNTDNHMVHLVDGSSVTMQSDEKKVSHMLFNGSFSLNQMKLSLAGNNVSTEGVFYPISWHHSIELKPFENGEAAQVTLNQDVKLLQGATVTIGQNVSVKANNLFLYGSGKFVDPGLPMGNDGLYKPKYQDENDNDAILTIEGNLDVGNISGPIRGSEGGTITFKNNMENYSSIEIENLKYKTIPLIDKKILTSIKYQNITDEIRGKIGVEDSLKLLGTAGTYKFQEYWAKQ